MPLEVIGRHATFTGHAEITEAEVLLNWLRHEDDPLVDLSRCPSAHTAVLQVLLALRPPLVTGAPPGEAPRDDWRSLLPLDACPPDRMKGQSGRADHA